MKKLKDELKMYLAEKMLGWIIRIVPCTQEGNILVFIIQEYFQYKVLTQNKLTKC